MATQNLGSRTSPPAVTSNDNTNPYGNGFWAVTFDPATLGQGANDFEIYHMSLMGPTGSSVSVYVNQTFYDVTVRGDSNSWDANQALYMRGGQSLIFYWNSAGTPHPKVTVWLRSV